MRRWWLWVLLAFVLTRFAAGWVTEHPGDLYPEGTANPGFDLGNYERWARATVDEGRFPYREVDIEYPPGSVGVALVPYLVVPDRYSLGYIVQSVAFDALGLVAMVRLARRRGSWWGVAAWLLLLPLLGPITYSRLDIVVAATLAWALERAEAGRWTAAGAWAGAGVAVKLSPALALPALVVVAPRRWRPLAAAVAVAALGVAPFVTDLGALYGDVARYHLDRGVHVESLWGTLAWAAGTIGLLQVELVGAFGGVDVDASWTEALKTLANVAALAVLADSALSARSRARRGDGAHAVLIVASTLVLLTAVGRVLSPQYLVWLVAPVAAGLAIAPRAYRPVAALFAVSALCTHLIYPLWYFELIASEWWAVALAVLRSLTLLGAGLLAAQVAWRWRSPDAAVAPAAGSEDGPAGQQHEPLVVVLADDDVGPHR